MVSKLTELYSARDNKAGLKLFFDNFIPETGEYALEEEEFERYRNKILTSVFGSTYKNQDFNSFIEKAFKDNLLELNEQLKRLGMEEIQIKEGKISLKEDTEHETSGNKCEANEEKE